jgi:hypothetical protein
MIFICIAITQNPQAFLRVQILNFQVNNNQPVHLTDVKTQVELKEKHRSTRDNTESKAIVICINNIFVYLRTSKS